MNDDEKNVGPQPWIDPALEARVVAGVLGETSAFEASELERILAENPELAIFKRRIEAVHALVGAAVRPEAPKIQLSPGRRQRLLESLGARTAPPTKNVKALTLPFRRWLSPQLLSRLVACLVIMAFVAVLFSLSIPAVTGSLHRSSRRSVLASSGISREQPEFSGKSGGFVSTNGLGRGGAATASLSAPSALVDHRVDYNGQAAMEGVLKSVAPAAGKPMGFAMNAAAEKEWNLKENAPPPASAPASSADDSGTPVPGKPGFVTSPHSPYAGYVDVRGFPPGTEVKDPYTGKSFQVPAAPEKQWPPVQQGRNSQQGDEYAELRSPGNQPQTMAKDQEKADLTDMPASSPLPAAKEKVRDRDHAYIAYGSPIRGNETGNVINQPVFSSQTTVDGKTVQVFDGFVNYGAPIAPSADAATALGVVSQPVFAAAASRPDSSTASPAPQIGDQLTAGQASAIKAFTGGWGKGSGSGTGARGEFAKNDSREQSARDAFKEEVAAPEPAKQNEASLSTGWDSFYMFRGVNVISQGADGTTSNSRSSGDTSGPTGGAVPMELAKAISLDGEDRQRSLNQSKGTDLVSNLEVTTTSGLRATNGIVSDALDSAGNKSAKLALAGANTYYGATAVSGGTLALANGAKVDAGKKAADNKSPAAPALGDVPLAGRLFRSDSDKDRSLSFQAEIKTAKQPFSTFSLHVSDVSFQLAKDALAKGTMPDPDRIRAEEFYNAFDYNDPSPGPGEEVACRIEQCAHPFVQQRDLVRIALKVAAAGRAAGQPLRLTILLDTSGSMEREDRAASVRRALGTLASLLGPNDRVTLIGFARTPRLLAEQVPGDQANKLVEIAAHTPSEGGTNLEQALALASELALKQRLPAAQNRIVLLTDGAANLGNADPTRLARQIEKTRQLGISFDACGVGANGLNDEMLEALTRKGDGRYYFLNRPEDADAGFARQLAGALRLAAENVKVQVVFNPARVGQYRLIGFEKHLLKKEDFRNDKVQAAELAAEEAGVALYQVETLAEGEGELGEVFVRFRDPATGLMVERSWTMPYDAKAPAFDKAAPSMQLATTAALLAEKLRGDSRVDLNAMSPVITNLRGRYPHQAKAGEIIRMFEKMRQ